MSPPAVHPVRVVVCLCGVGHGRADVTGVAHAIAVQFDAIHGAPPWAEALGDRFPVEVAPWDKRTGLAAWPGALGWPVAAGWVLLTVAYVQSGRMGFQLFPKVESDFARASASLPFGSPVDPEVNRT